MLEPRFLMLNMFIILLLVYGCINNFFVYFFGSAFQVSHSSDVYALVPEVSDVLFLVGRPRPPLLVKIMSRFPCPVSFVPLLRLSFLGSGLVSVKRSFLTGALLTALTLEQWLYSMLPSPSIPPLVPAQDLMAQFHGSSASRLCKYADRAARVLPAALYRPLEGSTECSGNWVGLWQSA